MSERCRTYSITVYSYCGRHGESRIALRVPVAYSGLGSGNTVTVGTHTTSVFADFIPPHACAWDGPSADQCNLLDPTGYCTSLLHPLSVLYYLKRYCIQRALTSHLYIFYTLLYIHFSSLFVRISRMPALLLVSGPRRLLALTGAVASRTTAAATSQLLAGSKLALRLATEGAAV